MMPSFETRGPNATQVTRFLERVATLTPEQWRSLEDAVPPLRREPLERMRSAAAFVRAVRRAPLDGRSPGDLDAVFDAIDAAIASGAVPDGGRDLAVHAGIAVLLQDLLPESEMQQWYGPFEGVIPRASL
jgi:hypothetical protein